MCEDSFRFRFFQCRIVIIMINHDYLQGSKKIGRVFENWKGAEGRSHILF